MAKHDKRTPRTRAETAALTRKKLLEAAREEVLASGTSASIRDIAKRAGFTQGAVYAQFNSKEDLLLALMAAHFEEVNASLDALLDNLGETKADGLGKLRNWIEALVQDKDCAIVEAELALFARRHPEFAIEFASLMRDHTSALTKHIARAETLFGTKFRLPSETIAAALISLGQGTKLNPNLIPSDIARIQTDYFSSFLGSDRE